MPKPNTAAIMLRQKRPVTLDDFLEEIFIGPKAISLAKELIKLAASGSLDVEKIREIRRERGSIVYYVLRKLKRLGMIQKRGGHAAGRYVLSTIFATHLAERAQFWRDYVSVARQ